MVVIWWSSTAKVFNKEKFFLKPKHVIRNISHCDFPLHQLFKSTVLYLASSKVKFTSTQLLNRTSATSIANYDTITTSSAGADPSATSVLGMFFSVGIHLLLMSECSSMVQGGGQREIILLLLQHLFLFFCCKKMIYCKFYSILSICKFVNLM